MVRLRASQNFSLEKKSLQKKPFGFAKRNGCFAAETEQARNPGSNPGGRMT